MNLCKTNRHTLPNRALQPVTLRQLLLALFVAASLLWAGNSLAMSVAPESNAPAIACSGPCSDPGGGG